MTTGFDLALSAPQIATQRYLHGVAPELRAAAAEHEDVGLDPVVLARHLQSAGLAPAALLESGIDSPHTLINGLEELAYGDPAVAWAAASALQIVTVLDACGTAAQKTSAGSVLTGVGPARARFLLYEDFGRQPSELETVVTTNAGEVAATGRKSSVNHPGDAEVTLLVGRENGSLAAFCFTGARAGISVDRDDRQLGKVAVTDVPTGAISLHALRLHPDERLTAGTELARAVGQSRLLLAACLIGLTKATVEFCSAYATVRTTWGQPLSHYQGVSFPLIEHSTELEVVRLLVWDVAARLTRLTDPVEMERQVARAVNRASSLALRASRDGVQLIGVRAITRDLPSERWYRQAAVLAAIDFDVLHTPFGLS